mgnify:CR=1 FL=1
MVVFFYEIKEEKNVKKINIIYSIFNYKFC